MSKQTRCSVQQERERTARRFVAFLEKDVTVSTGNGESENGLEILSQLCRRESYDKYLNKYYRQFLEKEGLQDDTELYGQCRTAVVEKITGCGHFC